VFELPGEVITALIGLGTAGFVALVCRDYLGLRQGIGIPEDWLPLLLGVVAAFVGMPLAMLLDHGIASGSGLRVLLVVFLLPVMVIGLSWASVQSTMLRHRLGRALERLGSEIPEPRDALASRPPAELDALARDVDEVVRLMDRRLRWPDGSGVSREAFEAFADLLAEARSSRSTGGDLIIS
jgi:hypothetical protein